MPAKRAYGMDQDFYPWSPIVARPVLRWPDNARVALAVIVNLEHWDWEVPAGTPVAVSPMGGPEGLWSGNQPQFPDIGGWGNHEYGSPQPDSVPGAVRDTMENYKGRSFVANAQSDPSAIDQRTRLLGPDSILDSLGLVALTVLIEDLRGAPIDPGDFADLDRFASVENIMRTYFDGVAHDPP